jgi:hypothetical protein
MGIIVHLQNQHGRYLDYTDSWVDFPDLLVYSAVNVPANLKILAAKVED